MDEFTHDIIHFLGDMKLAVETAMKKIEDRATKEALKKTDKEEDTKK